MRLEIDARQRLGDEPPLPELIRCPMCGGVYERELGDVGPHFEVVAVSPLRVTPKCLPGAELGWTGVVLCDALLAARPSPEPLP